MKEKAQKALKENGTPRRAFLSSALLTLTALAANSLGGCSRSDVAPNAADDAELESLRKVDPRYLTYREAARIATGMENPRGIAVSADGALFVVGDRALIRDEGRGAKQQTTPLEGEPTCIAVGRDDRLYLGMTDHVEVYAQDGKRLAVWQSVVGAGAYITAIAVTERDVWIANSAGRAVVHCDLQGRVIGQFGEKNEAEGYPGLIVPSPHLDVAPAPGGNLYVTNPGMHRVETHAPDGKLLSCWGASSSALDSFCGCCNPTDIALLPDGRFITSEKGIPRVKVYSATGQFQEVVAGPDAFASNTMGLDLAAAADGSVLVLDPKAKVVRLFQHVGAKTG